MSTVINPDGSTYVGPPPRSGAAPAFPLWMYNPVLPAQLVDNQAQMEALIASGPGWTTNYLPPYVPPTLPPGTLSSFLGAFSSFAFLVASYPASQIPTQQIPVAYTEDQGWAAWNPTLLKWQVITNQLAPNQVQVGNGGVIPSNATSVVYTGGIVGDGPAINVMTLPLIVSGQNTAPLPISNPLSTSLTIQTQGNQSVNGGNATTFVMPPFSQTIAQACANGSTLYWSLSLSGVSLTSNAATEVITGSQSGTQNLEVAPSLLGAKNVLSGTYLYVNLPAASSYPYKFAATADQGAVYSNGSIWQLLYNQTNSTIGISTGTPLPPGANGSVYSQQLASTNGIGTVVWSLVAQYGAANTFTLSSSGVLACSDPTVNGSTYCVVQVQDSTGAAIQKTLAVPIEAMVTPAATPTFSPVAGSYASAQTVAISSSTANATIYYTTNGSAPTLSSASFASGGMIVVGVSETLNAIAIATGFTQSAVGSAAYTIAPVNFVTTSPLNTGSVGQPYSQQMAGSGGLAPYTYAITAGSFASGLSLSPSGLWSGTPTATFSGSMTIQITDSLGNSASASFSQAVSASATAPAAPTIGTATAGNAVVTANWTANGDGGSNITGFTAYAYNGATLAGQTNAGAAATSATITGLTNGSNYTTTVVAKNVVGPSAASANSNIVTPESSISTYNGVIKVGTGSTAGKIVNGNNVPILLRGFNLPDLEACFAQQQSAWYGSPPNYPLLASLGANCVRIPLNSASWLSLNCYTLNAAGNGWVGGSAANTQNANPGGNYIAVVDAAIQAAQAQGLYVILDLHWSAPQFTLNGLTGYAMPLWQPPFMNSATDLTFWQQVATRYGNQSGNTTATTLGINPNGIIFDLFNEPYLDVIVGGSNGGNNSTTWGLMLNGGSVTSFQTNGTTGTVAQNWLAEGYQTVLNAIRAIGATNIILCGGPAYAHCLSGYASYLPTDSLGASQVAASGHFYPNSSGTYPNTGGYQYPEVYPDSGSGASSWSTPSLAVMAAGIPLIIGESGGTYGPAATSGEPFVSTMTAFAAANTGCGGLIEWQASEGNYAVPPTQNGTNACLTNANNLTTGQGQTFGNWLSTYGTGTTAPSAPTIGTVTAGNGQVTVNFTAPTNTGGAGVTITGYSVYAYDVTTSTLLAADPATSSPYIDTGLTNGNQYYFYVTATNSAGLTSVASANSATVTPSSGGLVLPSAPPNLLLLFQGQTTNNQTGSPPTPNNANTQTLGWGVATQGSYPIDHYQMQRTGANNTVYALISTTFPASGSLQYQDANATGCVGTVSGPYSAGTVNYQANTYLYQVRAVDTQGNVGPWSSTQSAIIAQNGQIGVPKPAGNTKFTYGWDGDFVSGATYNSTTPTPQSPNTECVAFVGSSTYPYWNPFYGNCFTEWNLWCGAFNYLTVDIYTPKANFQMNVGTYRRCTGAPNGDAANTASNGSPNSFTLGLGNYGTFVQNGWATFKIPLASLLSDYGPNGGSKSVIQNAGYKLVFQPTDDSFGYQIGYDNVRLVP